MRTSFVLLLLALFSVAAAFGAYRNKTNIAPTKTRGPEPTKTPGPTKSHGNDTDSNGDWSEDRNPIWKVFCRGGPMYRGRVDPIVNPGELSGHVHRVFGGNNFNQYKKDQSPNEVYDDLKSSSCTGCTIGKVDNSNYWHPEMYYQWPNGSFSVVESGGLTVYYLSRGGSTGLQKTKPNWQPIPKGLRMVAGDPYRRSYNDSDITNKAVSFACLQAQGHHPEEPKLQTDKAFCKNGLRAQIHFPMCWDGKNLDSADHRSHMSYPIGKRVDGGDCPSTHPVRIPNLFFEAFYSIDKYPHGQGRQPFIFANGDATGYGFHGDFLSAWDVDVMRAALHHPLCDNKNKDMGLGNNVKACPPLAPYVQDRKKGDCALNKRNILGLDEDIGLNGKMLSKLAGCNPVTKGPERAVPC